MNTINTEQLKNDLETKIGILKMNIRNGITSESEVIELAEIFEEYEKDGTTIEEGMRYEY